MDNSTISMAIFNSELFVYQRVLGFLWHTIWLVVSTHPSEKWWTSSVGIMTFPAEWTNKSHVPNHQPAISIHLWKAITNHSYNYSHWAKLQLQFWPTKNSYKYWNNPIKRRMYNPTEITSYKLQPVVTNKMDISVFFFNICCDMVWLCLWWSICIYMWFGGFDEVLVDLDTRVCDYTNIAKNMNMCNVSNMCFSLRVY